MKSISAFNQTDDYIRWQGRCIDQRTYEMMTSIETLFLVKFVNLSTYMPPIQLGLLLFKSHDMNINQKFKHVLNFEFLKIKNTQLRVFNCIKAHQTFSRCIFLFFNCVLKTNQDQVLYVMSFKKIWHKSY